MGIHKYVFCLFVCLLMVNGTINNNLLYGNETAIASLDETEGFVEVKPARDQKSVTAKDGFLLYVGDVIQTQSDGETTVIFRSGSEIRLFEDTEFIVDGAEELSSEKRSFNYKLSMKTGALWGNFVRGRQKTKINIGTATIGVKGTVFRIRNDGETANISITEGEILVENETSSITLEAGKRLNAFNKTDNLQDKVEEIPYRLSLQADKYYLEFKEPVEETVRLSIQMVDVFQRKNVKKAGKVYLQSNYYNVEFPENVTLNRRGFVRIPVKINIPHADDNNFDGKVVIWAAMGSGSIDDVGAGNVFIQMKVPGKRRHIRVDANTGNIMSVE